MSFVVSRPRPPTDSVIPGKFRVSRPTDRAKDHPASPSRPLPLPPRATRLSPRAYFGRFWERATRGAQQRPSGGATGRTHPSQ
jgi:hypothetical protein